MTRTRVAFQGEPGAFSEDAIDAFFAGLAESVPCRDVATVGASVESGAADYGLVPIENSIAGSVVATYDLLATSALVVVGEVVRPIRHMVFGLPGASLDAIRRVESHPVALAQCTRFLSQHPDIEAVAAHDTAGAARQIAERRDPHVAAIASRRAGAAYGLVVLCNDVHDRADNETRFFVVSRAGPEHPGAKDGSLKTVLVFETANEPGALVDVLVPFAERGVNLTKLESRPAGTPRPCGRLR